MTERESFLRRFHTARPGITSAGLRRTYASVRGVPDGYDRLVAVVPAGARVLDLACGDAYLVSRLGPRAVGLDLSPSRAADAFAGPALDGEPADLDLAPSRGADAFGGANLDGDPAGADLAPSRGADAFGGAILDGDPADPTSRRPGDARTSTGLVGGARLVAGRAQAMPFADAAFDACVCHLGFMLFDDVEQVVAELRRVVVPGGVFAAVLGGGPTARDEGDDAFHRFLAMAAPRGGGFGDRRARTEDGWRALFGAAPRFERFEVDLSGGFDEVWRFLGASYQLTEDEAPAIRARLRAAYADRARVPCRIVMWLAQVALRAR